MAQTFIESIAQELGLAHFASDLEQLDSLLWVEDDAGVLAWFEERCKDMIPRERRQEFLAGVYARYWDELS
jgi:hypothetical protein